MANPLQIQQNSQLIEDRAAKLFAAILSDYRAGTIKTKAELDYRLFRALLDFYNSIGKPTFQIQPVWGPPSSQTWNTMISQAYEDISTALKEVRLMGGALDESFQQVETQRQAWQNTLADIQSQLKTLAVKVKAKPHEQIFLEQFIDMSQYDQAMVKDTPANVIKESRVLALARTTADDWNSDLTVSLQAGNGFPGTTHQVRALSGTYKFYGEDNLHMNLADIVDGNQDTWFEYECFVLDPSTLHPTSGFGFAYEEGVNWALKQLDGLTFQLQLELPLARTMNWLALAPFLPADKGAAPAVITSLIINDGKGNYKEVSSGYDVFASEKIYQFPKIDCKTITLTLQQRIGYSTLIGHVYFNQLEATQIGYLEKDSGEATGKRIDGPKPRIENVQLRYDNTTQQLVLPSVPAGYTIPNETDIKTNLFQLPANPAGTQVELEALPAWRYMIGIRDIDLSKYQFQATSEYISAAYQTNQPIQEVSFTVEEEIPPYFAQSTSSGPWVQYSLSVDEGKTWYPIAPIGRPSGLTRYLINANAPKEARFADTGYIDTLQPVYRVRLKIALARPTDLADADYYTPLIRQYKIHVLTEENA